MTLEELSRVVSEAKARIKNPAFMIRKDAYDCLLCPTTKDKARTPYTREKNRRLI